MSKVVIFQYKPHDSEDFDYVFELFRYKYTKDKASFYERCEESEHTFLLIS